ncbi:MAG TPA: hypothetical protein H9968_02010 [Candidatus Anaerobutyricum stercoris]|uniref:Uncharacterized protein n=1 Tax=Candidatus Anaerobutyricum stercoris TaxID=2838457 RepID=A0A9D2EJD0_9FIRM|nr:hypothetical protein BN3660_02792 [Eubacteriaceae bacterium CHKCI004]HIZ38689.1 hypothetical protein [Candidatus Anaerobutyricum stercoris]
MKLMKRLAIGVMAATMAFSAMPAAIPAMIQMPAAVEAAEIEPRADVVYWIYRTLDDGTIQKRRWNETRGYWVDPDWIDVN